MKSTTDFSKSSHSLFTYTRTCERIDTSNSGSLSENNRSWWRHQMETFSALLAICAGNSPVTGEFHAQRPVTGSFDVFFDLRLNKRFSKQWQARWFETPSHPLWRHCNDVSRRPISLTCCSSTRNIEEDFLFSQSNFVKKKSGRCQNMYMTQTVLSWHMQRVWRSFSFEILQMFHIWFLQILPQWHGLLLGMQHYYFARYPTDDWQLTTGDV